MKDLERSEQSSGHPGAALAVAGVALLIVLALAGSLGINSLRTGPSPTPDPYADTWSALEWHDITATAFELGPQGGDGWDPGQSFVELHDRLFTNPGGALWTSTDSRTWQRVADAPVLNVIFATSGWLLGATTPLLDGQCMNRLRRDLCIAPTQLWYSWDGFYWVKSSVFGSAEPPGVVAGLATNGSRAVALVSMQPRTGGNDTFMRTAVYASTDGAAWAQASLPLDMATRMDALVTVTRYGFIVSAYAVRPGEATPFSPPDSASWSSPDGLRWASYHPKPVPQTPFNVLIGRLGDSMPGVGIHSLDGLTWEWDGSVGCRWTFLSSNGQEIVAQADYTYCVSLGDGRWQELRREGMPGSRPMGGRSWAIPGGVICVSGDHVYYGKGLVAAKEQQSS